MSLRTTLELDVTSALSGVSRLQSAIDRLSRPHTVTVAADTAKLTSSVEGAVDAADSTVTPNADTAQLTSSVEGAVDAADTTANVDVDTGSLNEAREAAVGVSGELAEAGVEAGGLSGALGGVKGAAGAAAGAFAAIGAGAFLASAVSAASDLEESINKAQVIFEAAAPSIQTWAKDSATAVGLSQQAAIEAASSFGSLFTATGQSTEAAAANSKQMVQLAADLASINNIPVDEALMRIQSGLVGETEPLRRVQVLINETAVAQKAAELGLVSWGGELTEGAKVQARYALIMEQTTKQQGDFGRTADGVANRSRIVKAQFENLQATIGQRLLPVVSALLGGLQSLIGGAERVAKVFDKRGLQGVLDRFAPALSSVPAAISDTVNAISGAVEEVVQAIEVPLEGLIGFFQERSDKIKEAFDNVVNALRPLAAGFAFVIGAIVVAWRLFGDEILSVIRTTFGQIGNILGGIFQIIGGIFDVFLAVLTGDWSTAWQGIKSIFQGVWRLITSTVTIALALINGVISAALSVITAVWTAGWALVQMAITTAWNAIKAIVSAAVEAVVGFVSSIPGRILAIVGAMLSAGAAIMGGLWTGLVNGWNTITGWLGGLPTQVLTFFAGAGEWLVQIGQQIMDGLLSGLRSAWESVRDFVGGIAGEIVSLKGPPEKDRVMLIPAGEALMAGLEKGLRTGHKNVLDLARSVAPAVSSTVRESSTTVTHHRAATTVVIVDPSGLRSALPSDVAAEVEGFLLGRARDHD